MAIIALTLSGILLFRMVIKPIVPKFSIADRLTANGALYEISALASRSAVTERSGGISGRKILRGVKKHVKSVRKSLALGETVGAALAEFYDNADGIAAACERAAYAASRSYLLGAVDGVPRIFSLCNSLVANTRGAVTRELLLEAIDIYNKTSPLSFCEIAALPDMLRLCICGMIILVCRISERRGVSADRGTADGCAGMVDLDRIFDSEYVCALFEHTDDLAPLSTLVEHNGVSLEEIDVCRRRASAELAAIMHSCICSLSTCDSLDDETLAGFSVCDEILRRNDAYEHADGKTKCECLHGIGKRAAKRGCAESAVAREMVDIAELMHDSVIERIFPRSALSRRNIVLTISTATLSAVVTVVSAMLVPRMYLWFILPIAAIVYACAGAFIDALSAQFIASHAHIYPNVRKDMKREKFEKALAAVMPALQAVLFIVCARYFDLGVFALAVLPLVTEFFCAVFDCSVGASIKPLLRLPSAFVELSRVPSSAIDGFMQTLGAERKLRAIIARALQAVVAVAVISVSAAFDNYVMIGIGALFIVPVFYDGGLRIKRVRKLKTAKRNVNISITPDTDDRYAFGENANYSVNLFDNAAVYVTTDSRGTVNIRNGGTNAAFDMIFHTPSGDVTLADCNGIAERHKTTYRAISSSLEVCAEVLAPPNVCGALCRVTAIGRRAESMTVDVEASCALPESEYLPFDRGAAVKSGHGVTAICLQNGVRFGVGNCGLSARTTVATGAFRKTTLLFFVLFARSAEELKRYAKSADETMCYERAAVSAKVFVSLGRTLDTKLAARLTCDEFDVDSGIGDVRFPTVVTDDPSVEKLKRFGFEFNYVKAADENNAYCDGAKVDIARAREIAVGALYTEAAAEPMLVGAEINDVLRECKTDVCERCESECDPKTPFGGLLGGELYIERCATSAPMRQTLGDGEACLTGNEFYTAASDAPVAICGAAIGMRGAKPLILDENNMSSVYGAGYTRSDILFDGCRVTLTKYFARGKGCAIFDVEINNSDKTEKTLDVMFFADAVMPRPLRVVWSQKTAYVTDRTKDVGFAMLSSRAFSDRTPYREGYRRRDDVDRTTDFRRDGIKFAPAFSVKCELKASGKDRVIFGIAAVDGISMLDRLDVGFADAMLADEKMFAAAALPIKPKTTDKVFDYLYSRSLYDAYIGYLRSKMRGGFCALPCIAAKYIDVEDAKSMLIADGRMALDKKIGVFDMLMYVLAVKDHINYTGDREFYSENVTESCTVGDSCIFALDTVLRSCAQKLNIAEYVALVKGVAVGCEDFRLNRYFAVMNDLKASAVIDRSGDDIITLAARAVNACEADDDAAANDLLRRVNEKYFAGGLESGVRVFDKVCDSRGADFAAAYNAIVARYLFGIERKGDTIEFEPHVSAVSPHIEYDLISRDRKNTIRVVIADGGKRGAWTMRAGNITYANSRLCEREKIETVYLLRDGMPI